MAQSLKTVQVGLGRQQPNAAARRLPLALRLLTGQVSLRRRGAAAPRRLLPACATVQPYPDPFPGLDPGDDLPEDYGYPKPNPPKHRRAGVVLHPTSLPGKYGIGEIGKEAHRFVDWLAGAGMQLWQVHPCCTVCCGGASQPDCLPARPHPQPCCEHWGCVRLCPCQAGTASPICNCCT